MAVLQYVERELLNHNRLLHPHIVQFREVRDAGMPGQHHCIAGLYGSNRWQHFTAGSAAQALAQLEVPHVQSMQAFRRAGT